MSIWNIKNGINITIPEGVFYSYKLPILTDPESTIFSVITRTLPSGMVIDNGYITGSPNEVSRLTTFSCVIRAKYNNIVEDRTFTFTIDGADSPEWLTPDGALPVGQNSTYFILDESFVDFQLAAIDYDTAAGQELSYWIASKKDGILPPGLTLSSTGRLSGWVQPLLAITDPTATGFYGTTLYDSNGYDYGIVNSIGYDSIGYDDATFDYSEAVYSPKKLNRTYEFIVTITDGDTSIRRKFNIFVVGDTLTADTTYTVDDTTTITSDSAAVREPVWITDSNLGIFRASNYKTIKFEIYKTVENYPVSYFLNTTNPDGTLSILPPGLEFDNLNAELYGVIPYQPAISKTYTFTITAIRIGHLQEIQADVNDYDAPIMLDDTIVLYRNTSLPGTENGPVYTNLLYVDQTNGAILSKATDVWLYHNYNTGAVLYANATYEFPWDITQWYSDSELILSIVGPSIIKLDSGGIYTNEYQAASSSKTFNITIIGNTDVNIEWQTLPDLGTMEANQLSLLKLNAICNKPLYYRVISGALPTGLTLISTGEIIGKAFQFESSTNSGLTNIDIILDHDMTTIDRQFSFEVMASDSGDEQGASISSSRLFTLRILTPNFVRFSDIWVKPFLTSIDREYFKSFIHNPDIFEHDAIFRADDPNFGVRDDLSMLIYAGIQTQSYASLFSLITKRKQFVFGGLTYAKAMLAGTHDVIYEVIYLNMIDPLENGQHLPSVITTAGVKDPIRIDSNEITIDTNAIIASDSYLTKRFPSSLSLWREQIKNLGVHDRHYLPLWMRTIQDGSMVELDYVPAVVLCFCKPGKATTIIANIQNSKFDFSQLSYDIDRFLLTEVEGYYENTFLAFRNDRTIIT